MVPQGADLPSAAAEGLTQQDLCPGTGTALRAIVSHKAVSPLERREGPEGKGLVFFLQLSLQTSAHHGFPLPPDLVVDAVVGAATEGPGEALGTTVDIAWESGTAFHTGALAVPRGCQVGTGGRAGCHTALIDSIGWTCQG